MWGQTPLGIVSPCIVRGSLTENRDRGAQTATKPLLSLSESPALLQERMQSREKRTFIPLCSHPRDTPHLKGITRQATRKSAMARDMMNM